MDRSFKAQFKYADRIGAEYTVALGDNEVDSGTADLKRMSDGTSETVKLSGIAERFA